MTDDMSARRAVQSTIARQRSKRAFNHAGIDDRSQRRCVRVDGYGDGDTYRHRRGDEHEHGDGHGDGDDDGGADGDGKSLLVNKEV